MGCRQDLISTSEAGLKKKRICSRDFTHCRGIQKRILKFCVTVEQLLPDEGRVLDFFEEAHVHGVALKVGQLDRLYGHASYGFPRAKAQSEGGAI